MRVLVIAWVLAGCSSVELEPTTVKVASGPAASRPIHKVVAVRASCGSLSGMSRTELQRAHATSGEYVRSRASSCTREQLDGVDQLVRSALEFRGYAVVDSERVNALTAARTEVIVRRRSADGLVATESSQSVTHGALFADAPPALQDEILAELGAEGLLHARIFVGATLAHGLQRDVIVQIRLVDAGDSELVWASRCRVHAGWEVDEVVIMEAARCAIAKIGTRAR